MTDIEATVFVVDDDDDIRKSLKRALEKRGYVVNGYASASAFLSEYDPNVPGCLLLDHGMPNMTGLELQEDLASRGHAIPIIFITGHGGVPESVQAIRAGAIDFLEKPFKQDVLLERIQTALETDAANRVKNESVLEAKERFGNLTDREREIAEWIVANPSNASSKEVARNLDISPRTVDHHRARILEKLHVGSVAELVDLAAKTGLFPDQS